MDLQHLHRLTWINVNFKDLHKCTCTLVSNSYRFILVNISTHAWCKSLIWFTIHRSHRTVHIYKQMPWLIRAHTKFSSYCNLFSVTYWTGNYTNYTSVLFLLQIFKSNTYLNSMYLCQLKYKYHKKKQITYLTEENAHLKEFPLNSKDFKRNLNIINNI